MRLWAIDRLIPYQNNARTHSEAQIGQIAASIREFGFTAPILADAKGGVLAGHGRLEAAKSIGMAKIPVIVLDHLTARQRRAYILADNKLALNAGWDDAMLASELKALAIEDFDLGLLGFDEAEIEKLIPRTVVEDEPGPLIDRAGELQEKWGTERGQIWEIGKHRLMCGDATVETDVAALLEGLKPSLLLTDPPYGINIVKFLGASDGGSKAVTIGSVRARRKYPFGGVKNMLGTVGSEHWADATPYRPVEGDDKPFDPIPILTVADNSILFGGNYFASRLVDARCWIVWDKNNTGNFADAELAWTSFDKGVKLYRFTWNGLVREGDRSVEGVHRVHPTQKPVGLFVRILEDFSAADDTVVDLYVGAGTTLLACELRSHKAFGMEIEPAYVAVCLERMAALGLEPRLA